MRWNLIHKDGSDWTQSEICSLKMTSDWVERVGMDIDGNPILLGRLGHYCYADEVTNDMIAVMRDE